MKKLLLSLTLACVSSVVYADGKVNWSYEGNTGPEKWGTLVKEFEVCKIGTQQAPLNIDTKSLVKNTAISVQTAYQPATGAVVLNNGHTIQINASTAGSVKLVGKNYQFVQVHFHTPSEETVDAKHYPFNAHLVHINTDDGEELKIGVIGVFFKEGKENAALKEAFVSMPAKEGKATLSSTFDLNGLIPSDKNVYTYTGSLTTPPCSEAVDFYIMKEPVEMSAEQLAAFKKLFPMNARPIQQLNNRKISTSN